MIGGVRPDLSGSLGDVPMKKTMEDYLNLATVIGIILIALLLPACAVTESSVKTHPNQQLSLRQPVKEIKDISHFLTFRSPPEEKTEVWVVDTITGKEVESLGTTPVRILVLRKKLTFIDGKVADYFDIKPVGNALTYGNGLSGGVEFQFKFRKYGYSDGMVMVRIPFLMGDSEKTLDITMKGPGQ